MKKNKKWDEDTVRKLNSLKFSKHQTEYEKCKIEIITKNKPLSQGLAEIALANMTLCENITDSLCSYEELNSSLKDLRQNPIIPNDIYDKKHYENCWEDAISNYKNIINNF